MMFQEFVLAVYSVLCMVSQVNIAMFQDSQKLCNMYGFVGIITMSQDFIVGVWSILYCICCHRCPFPCFKTQVLGTVCSIMYTVSYVTISRHIVCCIQHSICGIIGRPQQRFKTTYDYMHTTYGTVGNHFHVSGHIVAVYSTLSAVSQTLCAAYVAFISQINMIEAYASSEVLAYDVYSSMDQRSITHLIVTPLRAQKQRNVTV